jgi:hypothetical protein
MYFIVVFLYICYPDDHLLKEVETRGFIKYLKKLGVSTSPCITRNGDWLFKYEAQTALFKDPVRSSVAA